MEPEPPAFRLSVPPPRLMLPKVMLPLEAAAVESPRVLPVEPVMVPVVERLPGELTVRAPVPRLEAPRVVVPPDDMSASPEAIVAVKAVGPEVVRLSVPEPVVAVSVLAPVLLLVKVALPESVETLKLPADTAVPPV